MAGSERTDTTEGVQGTQTTADAGPTDSPPVDAGRGEPTGVGSIDIAAEGRRVGLAVSSFVVLGLGFVLTAFFASQFSAGGGFGSGLVGGAGVGSGFGYAILLSPLNAVVLGVVLGREGGDGVALDVGVGSAVGFVVMFFLTLMVAAGLQGGNAGGVGAGPLLGFTVGVGVTGAGSAAVAGAGRSLLESVAADEFRRPAVVGVGSFLTFGLGMALAAILAESLASGSGTIGLLGGSGMGSVESVLITTVLLAPMLGLVVGLFGTAASSDETSAAAGGGLAGGLGAATLVVTVYVVVMVLEPGGLTAGDFPFGPLVGFAVGTGLTGAFAGFLSH